MTESNREHLHICPQESVNFPSIEKVSKKMMTGKLVTSQCDRFSGVTPQDLTPLSVSPVCIEEYLPDPPLEEILSPIEGMKEDETAQSFLTANELTLPDEYSVKDVGHLGADAANLLADKESFVGEFSDKEVQVGVETKDGFTRMKKQKIRCAETNTDDDLPKEQDPKVVELETKLKEYEVAMGDKDVYIFQLEEQLRAVSDAENQRYLTVSRLEESLAESDKEKTDAVIKLSAQKAEMEELLEKITQLHFFTEKQEEEWRSKCVGLEEEKRSLDETLGSYMQAFGELEEVHGTCMKEHAVEQSRLLVSVDLEAIKNENNNNEVMEKDENFDKHSVFLASRIVDELVNFAFEERDLPKWTVEKIVADLVSSSLVQRKRETMEVGVKTVKVKTKSRKLNTETKEFQDIGGDPVYELSAAHIVAVAGCDPLEAALLDIDLRVDTGGGGERALGRELKKIWLPGLRYLYICVRRI